MPLWGTSHFDVISPQLGAASVDSHRDLEAGTTATAPSSPTYTVTMQSDERKVCRLFKQVTLSRYISFSLN